MFRKVNNKRKPAGPSRIRTDDDDDDEQADDSIIHQRIRETQKKHKFLAALPVASGEEQPSKRRFLSSRTSSHRSLEEESQNLTVLAQKHHRAMEEFIQGNMDGATTKDPKSDAIDSNDDPEAKLYQELAAATVPSKVLGAIEEDRGAMLVGGTGLAEVILPKDKRFDNSKDLKAGVRYSRNPHLSSAVAGTIGGGQSENILPTAGFRSMVPAGNNTYGAPEPSHPKLPSEEVAAAAAVDGIVPFVEVSKAESAAVDDSRPGFASLKAVGRKPTASQADKKPNQRGRQYQKDHEAFTKFIKRERDRR